MLAIATGLGRLQVVGWVIALVAFALLSLSAGRRATRPLGALLVFLALALPFAAVLAAAEGGAVFSRYTSIAPENVTTTSTSYKEKSLGLIPHYIASAPFGFGLATTGPAVDLRRESLQKSWKATASPPRRSTTTSSTNSGRPA